MTFALLGLRGVDVCGRLHQRRPADFRRGQRPGKYDRRLSGREKETALARGGWPGPWAGMADGG